MVHSHHEHGRCKQAKSRTNFLVRSAACHSVVHMAADSEY